MDKFDQLNTDADTRILKQQFIRIGEFDARQECWFWDGIMGKSIIFVSAEVAHLSDDDIWQRVADQLSLDSASSYTLIRQADYCFINYDFQV